MGRFDLGAGAWAVLASCALATITRTTITRLSVAAALLSMNFPLCRPQSGSGHRDRPHTVQWRLPQGFEWGISAGQRRRSDGSTGVIMGRGGLHLHGDRVPRMPRTSTSGFRTPTGSFPKPPQLTMPVRLPALGIATASKPRSCSRRRPPQSFDWRSPCCSSYRYSFSVMAGGGGLDLARPRRPAPI